MNSSSFESVTASAGLRTEAERLEGVLNAELFDKNPLSIDKKLEHFPKYVRRQNLTRFLALYELFKLSLSQKGSIIECGVNEGFGLLSWAKFSSILEPTNLTRRVYGFDSFAGFPSLADEDLSFATSNIKPGDLASDSFEELNQLISIYDSTRFIGHIPKVSLVKGDATVTIPKFIKDNPHVLISLLFLDFDIYEPTRVALEHFLPRMSRGSVLAFDELDNPLWPGETLAMLEFHIEMRFSLRRFEFDPYISYAILE